MKEELKEVEKLNFAFLQTHVDTLKHRTLKFRKMFREREQVDEPEQYGRRLCLRITDISNKEMETSES